MQSPREAVVDCISTIESPIKGLSALKTLPSTTENDVSPDSAKLSMRPDPANEHLISRLLESLDSLRTSAAPSSSGAASPGPFTESTTGGSSGAALVPSSPTDVAYFDFSPVDVLSREHSTLSREHSTECLTAAVHKLSLGTSIVLTASSASPSNKSAAVTTYDDDKGTTTTTAIDVPSSPWGIVEPNLASSGTSAGSTPRDNVNSSTQAFLSQYQEAQAQWQLSQDTTSAGATLAGAATAGAALATTTTTTTFPGFNPTPPAFADSIASAAAAAVAAAAAAADSSASSQQQGGDTSASSFLHPAFSAAAAGTAAGATAAAAASSTSAAATYQALYAQQQLLAAAQLGGVNGGGAFGTTATGNIANLPPHLQALALAQLGLLPQPQQHFEECLIGPDGRYQPYCRQIITEELNNAALRLLSKVKTLQLGDPPTLSRMVGKRYFCSLKEVAKVVGGARMILIAPDVRPSLTAHIKPVRLLQMVLAAADAAGVPYVFCLSRRGIGQVFGRDKSMSIVAVMNLEGIEGEYLQLLDNAAQGRQQFAALAVQRAAAVGQQHSHHHNHHIQQQRYGYIGGGSNNGGGISQRGAFTGGNFGGGGGGGGGYQHRGQHNFGGVSGGQHSYNGGANSSSNNSNRNSHQSYNQQTQHSNTMQFYANQYTLSAAATASSSSSSSPSYHPSSPAHHYFSRQAQQHQHQHQHQSQQTSLY